jgi:hypothetical protein
VRSRSPGLHQRGGSCRAKSFLMRCSARQRPWSTVLRCGQSSVNGRRRQRHNRLGGRDTPGSKAADRTLASIRARHIVCGPGIKAPVRWRQIVELVLYTVEGRRASDLRQTSSSTPIRKAKTARAIVWKVLPFCRLSLQGSLTRRIEHVRRHEGGGHAAFAAFVDPEEAAEATGTSHLARKTRQPHYDCD